MERSFLRVGWNYHGQLGWTAHELLEQFSFFRCTESRNMGSAFVKFELNNYKGEKKQWIRQNLFSDTVGGLQQPMHRWALWKNEKAHSEDSAGDHLGVSAMWDSNLYRSFIFLFNLTIVEQSRKFIKSSPAHCSRFVLLWAHESLVYE